MKHKIHLEQLAAKFAAAANHEAPQIRAALSSIPRSRELLLWMQAQAAKDGGLIGLTENLCALCGDSIGTPTMRRLGEKPSLSAKEREAILSEIPDAVCSPRFRDCTGESRWLEENFWHNIKTVKVNTYSPFDFPVRILRHQEFVDSLDRAAFQRLCAGFIAEFLPDELYRVCTQKDAWFGSTWYCEDLAAALIKLMDASAAQAQQSLARTAVAAAVFDALEFAIQKETFVRLDGNSRYGKTESVRAFAAMYPGKCRLVTTDCMNTDREFFGAIADALGVQRDYETSALQLRMKIDYIVANCKLCLIFDEFHWALPVSISRSKRPTRLDWIRSHLIDRGSPVVIVTTPQVFNPAMEHFRKITSWNVDQWDGRIRRHVKLPEKISAADLLAIVQKKAPQLSADWQEEIAAAARLVSGSYLAAVNAIIDTACWTAQRAGRAKPNDKDLESAIAEAAPNAAEQTLAEQKEIAPAPPLRLQRAEPALPGKHNRATRPAAADLKAPARSLTPETQPA